MVDQSPISLAWSGRDLEGGGRVVELVEVMGFGLITCWRVEDVISVLTLIRRGVAQVCHVLRVEELSEQLEVEEEEEGKEDGQEEEEEVESGESRVKERDNHRTHG